MVILGSASPRRRNLLALLETPIVVRTTAVDEDVVTTADPAGNALARARLKATALRPQLQGDVPAGTPVLTADTVVAIDDQLLNKPAGPAEARAMLGRLRGRPHQVVTAVVIHAAGSDQHLEEIAVTDVVMRAYSDSEIEAYIQTGDPFDKAGGYAIQHSTFQPVARIAGCYTAVVGLPLCRVRQTLLTLRPDLPLAKAGLTGRRWRTCRLCRSQFSPNLKK